jgi:uncharacterized protein (DUF305 family)
MKLRTMLLLLLAPACASPPADRAADTAAVAADTVSSAGAHDMAGMAMTGDADRDFLLMMSNHHQGLIELAHQSMLQGGHGTAESQTDAQILDARQDREIEQMLTMLKQSFQDPHEPRVSPSDQAVIDSVRTLSGAAYATAFYRAVVAHQRLAVAMIDEYLPKARRADVKALVEKMRQDHHADIKQFEKKAGE